MKNPYFFKNFTLIFLAYQMLVKSASFSFSGGFGGDINASQGNGLANVGSNNALNEFNSSASGVFGFNGANSDVHAAGAGTHAGDVGRENILVARDVVHHGDGSVYVQNGDKKPNMAGGNAMNLDDIHNQINKEMIARNLANLQKKAAELQAANVMKEVKQAEENVRDSKINYLKELDQQAAILKNQKPEVLAKKAIPVVQFTEETIPLKHHIANIKKNLEEIKAAEQKEIDKQKELTKLDDITDKFKFDNDKLIGPKLYQRFNDVGDVEQLRIDIPVLDRNGSFSIQCNSGNESHAQGDHLGGGMINNNGHTHFNDHGFHAPNTTVCPNCGRPLGPMGYRRRF